MAGSDLPRQRRGQAPGKALGVSALVCWDTLSSAAQFLRWHQLGALLQQKEPWRSCDCRLTAWQLDQRSQDKLDAICNGQDSKSSVRCLASQTILILDTFKNYLPARSSLWTLFHRMTVMCTRESPVIGAAQLP
ncbi:unnamed protein product [Lepidochelys olivacea]